MSGERGPTKREVDEAIASITGQTLPPPAPVLDGAYAAFLQGWLVMTVEKARADGSLPLKVVRVEQPDEDGNYLNHFIVHTQSGAEITVTFTQKGGDA